MMAEKNGEGAIDNAAEVIERFGGIRPMATKMDVPVTTVQGWKKRGVIPGNRRDQVIEAAQSNDIDLSGLVAGAANENSAGEVRVTETLDQDNGFEAAPAATPRTESVIHARQRDENDDDVITNNAAMMEQMRQAQSLTFTKSAWFSVGLVVFVTLIAALLLWPSKQQIDRNTDEITRLNGEIAAVTDRQSFFGTLIPDDLEARFSEIRNRTQQIQDQVTTISQRAEEIMSDVTDPAVPMGTRIERLEGHITELAGPSQLTGMLQKVQEWQQTAEGQTLLSGAMTDLNALIQGVDQEGGDLEQALQQAQGEDDALGEVLQGVAPQDLQAAALLLGLAQFRSSLNRSAPFEEDLALMQRMIGNEESNPELAAAIERLAPRAASGVLTPEGLSNEFRGLAGDVVVSSLKGEEVSIQERARARFNNVLQVEKDGELLTGTDTQAAVLRAQRHLDEGNIQAAIAELQSLEGEAAQTAQPFINEAEMTLIAEQLQGMFTESAIRDLIGGGGGLAGTGGGLSLPDIGAAAPDLQALIGEVRNLAPRRVISSGDSSFRILERQPEFAPELQLPE